MAEDHDVVMPRLCLFQGEHSPPRRTYPEYAKKLRGRLDPGDLLGAVGADHVERRRLYQRECLERPRASPPLEKVQRMDVDGAVGTERLLAQNDQPLRAAIGQGPEEDGIDECEDGRVCADAEGEGQYANGGESRALSQPAERVSHVLANLVEERYAARVTALFLALIEPPHLSKGGVAGIAGRHAGGDVLLGEALQMKAQLLVELLLDAGPPEQRAKTQTKLPGPPARKPKAATAAIARPSRVAISQCHRSTVSRTCVRKCARSSNRSAFRSKCITMKWPAPARTKSAPSFRR